MCTAAEMRILANSVHDARRKEIIATVINAIQIKIEEQARSGLYSLEYTFSHHTVSEIVTPVINHFKEKGYDIIYDMRNLTVISWH